MHSGRWSSGEVYKYRNLGTQEKNHSSGKRLPSDIANFYRPLYMEHRDNKIMEGEIYIMMKTSQEFLVTVSWKKLTSSIEWSQKYD